MTDVNLTDIVQKIVRLNELQEKLQERQQQLKELLMIFKILKRRLKNLYNYYCFLSIIYNNGTIDQRQIRSILARLATVDQDQELLTLASGIKSQKNLRFALLGAIKLIGALNANRTDLTALLDSANEADAALEETISLNHNYAIY